MSSSPSSNSAGHGRLGGHILVDALVEEGVDLVFGVPGESYLAVIDGLQERNGIRTVMCRQEGGAAMMADAYGKLTGRPGVCMVTRGPGATNASAGVHVAFQDSTPMVLLVGQVARWMVEREAFQEIDYRRMFGQMAKWVAQIDDAARIPEYISRAFHTAVSGRPGPVVLALPEDMLMDYADVAGIAPYVPVEPHPGQQQMADFRSMLDKAERPIMIVGGGGWDRQACERIEQFAVANGVPVGASFRCQDYFDNRHPNYVGHVGIGIDPSLAARIQDSDMVIALGTRLGEMTTGGYTMFDIPRPKQTLVHIHGSAEELGRVYQADMMINSGPRAFAEALEAMKPVDGGKRSKSIAQGHADYLATLEPLPVPGDVQMGEIAAWLNATLPDDAIITNGAGNYANWMHRYYQYRGYRTQLAPTSGSMGYGLPAAVAAALVHPDRVVVSMNGDGCFMMHGQELATAMQHGAKIIAIVINNNMYGTIRMHQEREFPGRVKHTDLQNPDFAALAKAYGANGETVLETSEFKPAFERALASDKSTVIEVKIDPEAITPKTTLSAIRKAALEKAK
jgi:acetolactate synthase I/II/III large subunit